MALWHYGNSAKIVVSATPAGRHVAEIYTVRKVSLDDSLLAYRVRVRGSCASTVGIGGTA